MRSKRHPDGYPFTKDTLTAMLDNPFRPFLLEPVLRLTVGVRPDVRSGVIGEVIDAHWNGMRHREIGQVQAWHYPTDRLSVIWEAYYYEPLRLPPLPDDRNMSTLWGGVESFMVQRFPTAEQLVTPTAIQSSMMKRVSHFCNIAATAVLRRPRRGNA